MSSVDSPVTWAVVGAGGMLGTEVVAQLMGRPVLALTRTDLDVTNAAHVRTALDGVDCVVNCAAWTAVDDAEAHESEAYAVNATGAANLAAVCADSGAHLVQVSTDYVFDGTAVAPYAEDAELAPMSAYGRTKAAGEQAVRHLLADRHYIVRTAWLYGDHGPNFVRTITGLEATRTTLDVVDDQRGQPTWAVDLARQIVALVDAAAPAGTYHGTNSGETTWFGLAQRIFELIGADPQRVRPVTSEAFPRPAPRPRYSVLGHGAWARCGVAPMRHWSAALDEAWPLAPTGA